MNGSCQVHSHDFSQHPVSLVAKIWSPPQILEMVILLPTWCNFHKNSNLPFHSFKPTPSFSLSPSCRPRRVFSLYLTLPGSGLNLARETLWVHTKNVHLGRILSCFLKEENSAEYRTGNNVLMGGFLLQSSSYAAAETTHAVALEWSLPRSLKWGFTALRELQMEVKMGFQHVSTEGGRIHLSSS